MLLNNLHALRIHTQGIFEDMGGEEVSEIWFVCDRSVCVHTFRMCVIDCRVCLCLCLCLCVCVQAQRYRQPQCHFGSIIILPCSYNGFVAVIVTLAC